MVVPVIRFLRANTRWLALLLVSLPLFADPVDTNSLAPPVAEVSTGGDSPIDTSARPDAVSQAAPTQIVDEEKLKQQRKKFVEAELALKRGDWRKYDALKSQLVDYPLYPYLQSADIAVNLSLKSGQKVRQFLDQHSGSPAGVVLHNAWLRYLMRRDHYTTFIKDYRGGTGNVSFQCYYEHARYRDGDRAAALEGALALWNVGKSQPKECDGIFALLISNNQITEEIAWQRYNKAILAHQFQLARYLQRFFTDARYKILATRYYEVDRNPNLVGNYRNFTDTSPETAAILAHGLAHLAARNAKKALSDWTHYRAQHTFDAAQTNAVASAIIKGLFDQGHNSEADSALAANSATTEPTLIEWRIREAIQTLDWPAIAQWTAALPDSYAAEPEWRYWKLRAQEALNKLDAETIQQQYAAIASERTFYGFLASERLSQPYNLNHSPVPVTAAQVALLAARPDVQRAREFYLIDQRISARREWYAATQRMSEQELQAAAVIAHQWGWYDRAIFALIAAGTWDDITLRFPTPWKNEMEKASSDKKIPLSTLYAIARQETALDPQATSPAGAMGLIQVMPSTARMVAKQHHISYQSQQQLHDLPTNLKIGSTYYRDMLDRFDNNRVLASAAYNAGPHRVDRWLKESKGTLPVDAWIETIPFKETRGYVKNILAFAVIYNHNLGIEGTLLEPNEREKLL